VVAGLSGLLESYDAGADEGTYPVEGVRYDF
jgi:hypothetical protein